MQSVEVCSGVLGCNVRLRPIEDERRKQPKKHEHVHMQIAGVDAPGRFKLKSAKFFTKNYASALSLWDVKCAHVNRGPT